MSSRKEKNEMNDSVYEEYMRNVLGYNPINYRNTYEANYENYETPNTSNIANFSNVQNEELEKCYPEIYKIIYPMIQKTCMQNMKPITRELIDDMTEEIYFAVEDNEIIETRSKEINTTKELKNTNSKTELKENRQRIIRNQGLNDLIRILILRELLGRPGFPGRPRPPRPPRPRPPYPPVRPMHGMYNRQTYNNIDDNYDLFEY